MEWFGYLLVAIGGVAFWVAIVGLIKPAWVKMGNRKEVMQALLGSLVLVVVGAFFLPTPPAATSEHVPVEPAKQESVGEIVLSDAPQTNSEQEADRVKQITELEQKARKKDYQAQRNLAYMLSGGQLVGHRDATDNQKVSACAWRYVIVKSGSDQVSAGDQANFATDCGKLSDPQKDKAADDRLHQRRRTHL